MNDTEIYNSIETDKSIYIILSNFSDDFVENAVTDAFRYKFRPFNTRMPNLPFNLNLQLENVKNHYTGDDPAVIESKKLDVFGQILNIVCNHYDLQITNEIPDESLYSLTFQMYSIFVSEFSDRMIRFFTDYILSNKKSLINMIPEGRRNISAAAKKQFSDSPDALENVIIYQNIKTVLDLVAGLDIPMFNLVSGLSDVNTANFICSYISDVNDLYKNHYAKYITDRLTYSDMASSISLNIYQSTTANAAVQIFSNTDPEGV